MCRVHEKLASGRLIACTNAIIPTSSKNKKERGSDVDKGSYYTWTFPFSNSGCKPILEWLFILFSVQCSGCFSSHVSALCFSSQQQWEVINLKCQILGIPHAASKARQQSETTPFCFWPSNKGLLHPSGGVRTWHRQGRTRTTPLYASPTASAHPHLHWHLLALPRTLPSLKGNALPALFPQPFSIRSSQTH